MANALKVIPLTSIRENPVALRTVNRGDPDYICLIDSIKDRGVLNPILVRELPKGDDGAQLYGLIDGLHRFSACCDGGLDAIPAQIINMDDGAVLEAQLIGNAHKIETKPVQYSDHLRRILASNPLMTITQLAMKLSKTTSWLGERLGLLKLDKGIASLVDEGKINLTNAYALAKLPEAEQTTFVDRAMTMTPQEFTPTVAARKSEIDTAKRQGRDPKPSEFVPVPFLQKLLDLKSELEKPTAGPVLCRESNLTTAEEGFAMGVRFALHMDPRSIEASREKDAQRKREQEESRKKAAAERATKRAQEAADAAVKAVSV